MARVFVIAPTPMQQAGLRVMLTSSDIEIVGESLVPDVTWEELSESDVIVIADEVLLEDAVRTIPRDENGLPCCDGEQRTESVFPLTLFEGTKLGHSSNDCFCFVPSRNSHFSCSRCDRISCRTHAQLP